MNLKVFTSKFVGTGPLSNKKIIYRATVSQRLRNTELDHVVVENYPDVVENAIILHHNAVTPSAGTVNILWHWGLELIQHTCCTPDLVSCD